MNLIKLVVILSSIIPLTMPRLHNGYRSKYNASFCIGLSGGYQSRPAVNYLVVKGLDTLSANIYLVFAPIHFIYFITPNLVGVILGSKGLCRVISACNCSVFAPFT